jgi:HAD superfamily hydrolase (TIGR01662 family)
MRQKVVMMVGFPAAGKGTLTRELSDEGYVVLNRDSVGGSIAGLVPKLEDLLAAGKSVVLDNTNGTVETRKQFIDVCKNRGVAIEAFHVDTSIEDAQINALHRMWDRYRMIFYTDADIKAHPDAKKDPNIFPVHVLFSYRKQFEKPTTAEGFTAVKKINFERRPLGSEYHNSAVIFDYDDTLRTVAPGAAYKYPTKPEEVTILPGRAEKLQALANQGVILLGVSNQSGIAKGHLSVEDADRCFRHTNEQLGVNVDYKFCRHAVPPVSCYCRKPGQGIAIELIRRYYLDPAKVLFVGDQTTDRTFAMRAGFAYSDQADYFA